MLDYLSLTKNDWAVLIYSTVWAWLFFQRETCPSSKWSWLLPWRPPTWELKTKLLLVSPLTHCYAISWRSVLLLALFNSRSCLWTQPLKNETNKLFCCCCCSLSGRPWILQSCGRVGMQGTTVMMRVTMKTLVKTECTRNSAWNRLKRIPVIDSLIYFFICVPSGPIDATINHCHTKFLTLRKTQLRVCVVSLHWVRVGRMSARKKMKLCSCLFGLLDPQEPVRLRGRRKTVNLRESPPSALYSSQ